MSDYVLFKNKDGTDDNKGLGGLGGLGGWVDNTAFKRLDNYEKHKTHEVQQKREINQNSVEVNGNTNIYTTENIIQNGDNNANESFVAGEILYLSYGYCYF